VRHRAVVERGERDVALVELDAVDEQRAGDLGDAQLGEQVHGRVGAALHLDAAAAEEVGERALGVAQERDLGGALAHVHRDREPLAHGPRAGVEEEVLVHRVDGVGAHADADAVAGPRRGGPLAERADGPGEAGEGAGALRRVGAEHLLVDHAAGPQRAEGVERRAARGGVGVGGHAGGEPLAHARVRRVAQVVAGEDLGAGAGEGADPCEEVGVLEEAAEGGELEVRVRVDEAGEEDGVAEVGRRAGGRRAGGGPDVGDAPVVADGHGAVRDRGRRDGDDPAGGVDAPDGHRSGAAAAVRERVVQRVVGDAARAGEGERPGQVADLLAAVPVGAERQPNARRGGPADEALVRAVPVADLERDAGRDERAHGALLARLGPQLLERALAQRIGRSVGWASTSTGISRAKRSSVATCASMYASESRPAGQARWNMCMAACPRTAKVPGAPAAARSFGSTTACSEPTACVSRRQSAGGVSSQRSSCQQNSPLTARSGASSSRTRSSAVT
jgi:hypothetical protein